MITTHVVTAFVIGFFGLFESESLTLTKTKISFIPLIIITCKNRKKKKMRTVVITLLTSLILVGRLMAQNPTVTGQVADQSGRPIPFANVLILAATDSALVTGGVTDESGAFRLEAGPSAGLLKVSFIGFEDKYLSLTSGQANLGTITLREATEALAEAVVRIRTVRRQDDGFGLNARSSWYQSEHNTDLLEQLEKIYVHSMLLI